MTSPSIVALAIGLSCIVLGSCTDDGVQPAPFTSKDLEHEVGTRLITRTLEIENEVVLSTTFDTMTVAAREEIEGGNKLVMADGRIWRVQNGLFQLLFDQFAITLGKVPCPIGRWPEPVDTMPWTNEVGDTLALRFLILVTRSPDSIVTVPAGSFRCAVVDAHLEYAGGGRDERFGTMQFAYAPGTGSIQTKQQMVYRDQGQDVRSELRTELYRIER